MRPRQLLTRARSRNHARSETDWAGDCLACYIFSLLAVGSAFLIVAFLRSYQAQETIVATPLAQLLSTSSPAAAILYTVDWHALDALPMHAVTDCGGR